MKISNKYLLKLRTRYRKFDLTEFDEWHFTRPLTTQLTWSKDDFHHYRYYNWGRYKWAIFKSKDCTYDKWFSLSYDIFNAIRYKSLSSLGGLDEAIKLLDKNMISIKNLVEKIDDLSKLTIEQKNYFLYDDSNIISHTFYTELNRKVQTYQLISTAALGIRSTNMITPKKSFKINVQNEEYKENIVIQLERLTKEESIKVKDDKVSNFSILATREKKKIGNKRSIPYEIIDQVKIDGLRNFDAYDKLNPVDINIRDSKVNSFLARFGR